MTESRQVLKPFVVGSVLPLKSSLSVVELKRDEQSESISRSDEPPGKIDEELQASIIVIDENMLARSCLIRCLAGYDGNFSTVGYASVEAWQQAEARGATPIVLLCAAGRKATETVVRRDLDFVMEAVPDARVMVVSDVEETSEIVGALERGAKGYIAMSSNLDVAIAAIRLVRAGGTFVPASGLLSSRAQAPEEAETPGRSRQTVFTQRQLEVIDRLRQGESNKLIAYKLNMGECTVKVHVRNIMRKIKARNRTEIAFLTNELF